MKVSADKIRIIFLALLIILAILAGGFLPPKEAHAGCSSYIGRAVINEIRSGPLTFLEVKILDPTIDSSVFNNWSLMVCNSREGCSGPHSLAIFTDSDPYYTTSVVPEVYINLSTTGSRAGTDFLLTDANGDAIDYLSVAGFTMQQVVCGYQFDTTFPGSNSFEAARLPDGTGNWSDFDSGGNSIPPTEGDTNDDPFGVLPRLQTAGVTVYEGGTADFVVALVDTGGNPTTASSDITVQFNTVDGTATVADGDYTATSGVLTILAGAGSGTISVDTLMDAIDDDGENFYIFLSNAVNASVLNNYALATISGTLPSIDHFRIQNPGTALTCQRAAVIITACENAACDSTYNADLTISLSPSGWVGGDTQTLSGGTGTFYLRHNTPGPVTLGVTSVSPAPANPAECYPGGSCGLEFFNSGFIFTVPNLTSCVGSIDVSIQAVRLDDATQTCIAAGGFAGQTKTVNFWSSYLIPGTGSTALSVNGAPVSGAAPGTGVSLTFDASAQSSFTTSYNDAGQLQLNTRYDGPIGSEEEGLVMIGNDTFVVNPDHLTVVATTDGATQLNNSIDNGDPHFPAGQNFFLTVTAVCPDGTTVTPNFAWDTDLAVSSFEPSGGTPGNFNYNTIDSAVFSGGVTTINDLNYSEVGTVTMQATAANYLGAGDVVGSTLIGRFTPDHFAVAYNVPRVLTGCGTGGFTYVGQFFEYETQPDLTVTAENGRTPPEKTSNYTDSTGGDWFKISNLTLGAPTYASEAGTTLNLGRLPATPDPTITDNGTGTADLIFSVGSVAANEGIAFVRSDPPVAPFNAEISLAINVVDGDGIVFAGNPAQFGAPSPGNGIAFDNGKQMRWGRLILQNAFGPEILPLSVPLLAEYYVDADTGFVLNSADSCTALTPADLTLTTAVAGPQAGSLPIAVQAGYDTTASFSTPTFTGGDAGLSLSAPGEGGDGWVDITIDLSTATGLDWPWLQFDWDNDTNHDNDPTARATFGIYKGNSHRIYLRQTFR